MASVRQAEQEAHRARVRQDQRDDQPKPWTTQRARDGGRIEPCSERLGQLFLSRADQRSVSQDQRTCAIPVPSVVERQAQATRQWSTLVLESMARTKVRPGPTQVGSTPPAESERMNLLREPDAGDPHVRFDEREVETEQDQAREAPTTERVGQQIGLI